MHSWHQMMVRCRLLFSISSSIQKTCKWHLSSRFISQFDILHFHRNFYCIRITSRRPLVQLALAAATVVVVVCWHTCQRSPKGLLCQHSGIRCVTTMRSTNLLTYLAGCGESWDTSTDPKSSKRVDDNARQEVNQCSTVCLSSVLATFRAGWISSRVYCVAASTR